MKTEWVDVNKQLPDDGIVVLIALIDTEVWTGYYESSLWFYMSGDKIGATVTHWMPFPPSPSMALEWAK